MLRGNITRLAHLLQATLMQFFFMGGLWLVTMHVYERGGQIVSTPVVTAAAGAAFETFLLQLSIVAACVLLPLVLGLFSRWGWLQLLTVGLVVAGQLMGSSNDFWADGLLVGGGLLFNIWLIRHRPQLWPASLILAFVFDQILRAAYTTQNPMLTGLYPQTELIICGVLAATTLLGTRFVFISQPQPVTMRLSLAGGLAFGAVLYAQLSFFNIASSFSASHGAALPGDGATDAGHRADKPVAADATHR